MALVLYADSRPFPPPFFFGRPGPVHVDWPLDREQHPQPPAHGPVVSRSISHAARVWAPSDPVAATGTGRKGGKGGKGREGTRESARFGPCWSCFFLPKPKTTCIGQWGPIRLGGPNCCGLSGKELKTPSICFPVFFFLGCVNQNNCNRRRPVRPPAGPAPPSRRHRRRYFSRALSCPGPRAARRAECDL